jgi:hypothetical protein
MGAGGRHPGNRIADLRDRAHEATSDPKSFDPTPEVEVPKLPKKVAKKKVAKKARQKKSG